MSGLDRARQKMEQAGVAPEAIEVFSHYYAQLESGATGLIPEDTISPLTDTDQLADVQISENEQQAALAKTAIIKLNGGLGTSMGLEKAKSLLPVRDGKTFLDLIAAQVLAARESYGVDLPLIFMNSFRTHDDTVAALQPYEGLVVNGLPLDFLQNREPKLLASDLTPVEWPADPSLEWCPPGHGDLYTAVLASGVLQALRDAGCRYASVSNADNLGAAPNAAIAGWFAASGAPFAAELCRRTKADLKGGHLALRKSDSRLILRDIAQTPDDEMKYFTDEQRHPFFNTNNLWFDLDALQRTLVERKGVLGLPLIKNVKTVDPTDSSTPEVIQIESAMGSAVEVFEGAKAIVVGRERFLPVKTTDDLLLLRSDCYTVGDDGTIASATETVPLIDLDSRYYKKIAAFDAHFPAGPPSLVEAERLSIKGDWTFGRDVRVEGAVTLEDDGTSHVIPDGKVIGS